jgi:hypothetical protein
MLAWNERREPSASQRPLDHRSAWQRDKARILHSAAFRRLQAKTQIMGVGLNDFYRTRLTHSLEAAQIGTALVAQLKLNATNQQQLLLLPEDSLMEALCLAHDIGHPPYATQNDKRMFVTIYQDASSIYKRLSGRCRDEKSHTIYHIRLGLLFNQMRQELPDNFSFHLPIPMYCSTT